jgi:hypothetical protein
MLTKSMYDVKPYRPAKESKLPANSQCTCRKFYIVYTHFIIVDEHRLHILCIVMIYQVTCIENSAILEAQKFVWECRQNTCSV